MKFIFKKDIGFWAFFVLMLMPVGARQIRDYMAAYIAPALFTSWGAVLGLPYAYIVGHLKGGSFAYLDYLKMDVVSVPSESVSAFFTMVWYVYTVILFLAFLSRTYGKRKNSLFYWGSVVMEVLMIALSIVYEIVYVVTCNLTIFGYIYVTLYLLLVVVLSVFSVIGWKRGKWTTYNQ